MSNTTICTKCKIIYREEYYIVIKDFRLHVCPDCMQEIKDKIIKDLQNDI